MSQLSAATLEALNAQYAHEKRNQLIYESMASGLDFFGLTGSAKFLRSQAEGEAGHAKIVYDFINQRNEHAVIRSIELIEDSEDFYQIFQNAMALELSTTEKLKSLAQLAFTEGDLQTFFGAKL